MDESTKIALIQDMCEIDGEDKLLSEYLEMAGREIHAFLYLQRHDKPNYEGVPEELEMVQIHAVVAGYSIRGAENQSVSIENGIHRHFKYSDMVDYIRNTVIPYAGLGGT